MTIGCKAVSCSANFLKAHRGAFLDEGRGRDFTWMRGILLVFVSLSILEKCFFVGGHKIAMQSAGRI